MLNQTRSKEPKNPDLPREIAEKLHDTDEARWDNPDSKALRSLPVKTSHWDTMEKETSINVDTKSDKIHVCTSERGGVTALLRHDEARYVSCTLVKDDERGPTVQYVYAELPIGCLTVKERSRKNTALSQVFKT